MSGGVTSLLAWKAVTMSLAARAVPEGRAIIARRAAFRAGRLDLDREPVGDLHDAIDAGRATLIVPDVRELTTRVLVGALSEGKDGG